MTTPPDFEDPRKTLARHGFAPKRSFSQNFLTSREVVDKIAAATIADDGELVVEHSTRRDLPVQAGELVRTDTRKYGESSLSFYRRGPAI